MDQVNYRGCLILFPYQIASKERGCSGQRRQQIHIRTVSLKALGMYFNFCLFDFLNALIHREFNRSLIRNNH